MGPVPVRRKKKKRQPEVPTLKEGPLGPQWIRKQSPQKKGRAPAPPHISTGLALPTRKEAPRRHQRGRFAAPFPTDVLERPPAGRLLGDPNYFRHPLPTDIEKWAQARFLHPDPQDELRVLGYEHATLFARERDAARKNLARQMFELKQAQHEALAKQVPHGVLGWTKAAPGIAYHMPGAMLHAGGKKLGEAGQSISDKVDELMGAAQAKPPPGRPGLTPYLQSPYMRVGIAAGAQLRGAPNFAQAVADPLVGKALVNFATGDVSQLWKHPFALTAETAMMIPALRPLKGARGIAAGIRASARPAMTAADIEAHLAPDELKLLTRARNNLYFGRELTPRQQVMMARFEAQLGASRKARFSGAYQGVMQGHSLVGKAIIPAKTKIKTRVLRARGMETRIPAAGSLTGRTIEGVADGLRVRAGERLPGVKSMPEKAMEEKGRMYKYQEIRPTEGPEKRLLALDKKLNEGQQSAIRLVLEGDSPAKAVEHHYALAASPDVSEEQKAFHMIHAKNFEDAAKYIEIDAEGRPTLKGVKGSRRESKKAGTARYIHEAADLLERVAKRREMTYKEMFALSDKAIANRLIGPSRVRAGARWQEAEKALEADLQTSPLRKAAMDDAQILAARQTTDPERQRVAVEALMSLWDSAIRVMGREVHGDQAAWREFEDFIRFGRGPLPEDALGQSAIIQAKGYWNQILEGAAPDVLAKIPSEGKITINDLLKAQRAAYEHGDEATIETLRGEIDKELGSRGPYLFQRRDLPIDVGDPIQGQSYPFYSKVGRVVSSFPPGKKIGSQELRGRLKSADIRDEEIAQAQIDQFVEGKKSVSREETLAWLDEHFLTLEENVRYQHPPRHITDQLGEEPGGSRQGPAGSKAIHGGAGWTWPGSGDPEAQYGEINIRLPEDRYGGMYDVPGGHFPNERNTIVHVRFTTRPVNDKKMLLIEEIQSDWHKAGIKRGFSGPLENDPEYQRLVTQQGERMLATDQAREKVNEAGDWYWGQRFGPETIGDMPAPEGTLGIERALGINLNDETSVDSFAWNLNRIAEARQANATGGADYRFEIRPTRYQDGIEIGYTFPAYRRTRAEPLFSNNYQQQASEDWRAVRAGLNDSDHWQYGVDYGPQGDAEARAANIRAASSELDSWSKLMSLPDQDFRELQARTEELNNALTYQRVATSDVRSYSARRGSVTQMPFEDTWHELGFKRMLAWATDNGFEKIGWLKGAHQAERYNLANFYTRIEVEPGAGSIPEVGSNEYYDALESSYNTQDYYDHLDENVPSEPERDDFRQDAEYNVSDTEPHSANYDTMDEYYAALNEWEPQVEEEQDRLYNDAYYEWQGERESAHTDATASWDEQFADNWHEYAAEQGYGDEHGWEITATRADTGNTVTENVDDHQLEDYLGEDLSRRIRDGETVFEGDALAMGDAAQSALDAQLFYDKKFRSFIDKYMKRWDVKPRMEALGSRRVVRKYDVYYRPHASTVEVGKDFTSLEQAQGAMATRIADSERFPNWRIVDRATGNALGEYNSSESAENELRNYILPQAREGTDYAVEQRPPFTRDDFQIVPREEEKWVGPEPKRATFSVEERQDIHEGSHFFETVIHWPDGEVQATESYSTHAEAQARVNQLEQDQQRAEAPTGFPYGEPVHSIDLPTPPEKDWNSFIQYKLGLGEKVTMHDPKAAEEFAAWHPEDKFREFMGGGQPLYGQPLKQRRGLLGQPGSGTVRGVTGQDPQYALRAVINFTEHGDITTFVHEVFGHWAVRFLPAAQTKSLSKFGREAADALPGGQARPVRTGNFNPDLGPVDEGAAEAIAYAMEAYVREGHGPTPVKQAIRSLAPYFREAYDGVDLPDTTPVARQVFDRIFAHEPVKGGKLVDPVGVEDIPNFSVARVAYEPGRPLPTGVIQHKVAAVSQYILSGGKTIAKGPIDQALNHQYRGAALISGYFTANAIKPTVRDALLATRIATVHRLREDLLKAATDLPSSYTDIAIKEFPDRKTPKGVQTILNKMRELDHAKGGKLTAKDMEKFDFDMLEEGSRDVFPNQLQDADGNPKDIREWAMEALNEQQHIPGIKWIPVEWLDSSGLTPPPGWKGTLSKTMAQGNPGLTAWDFVNDVNKLAVLYLNPAYVPINLAGNLVMNIMQQGVFAPTHLWRSALMHQWLDGMERKMIDNEMGNGLTASLGTLRGSWAHGANATLGHWANQAVDLIPRRAAFLHEARRAGYKTKEQVRALLRAADAGDARAKEDMGLIAYRANDAIVDYERMSPLERAITSRLIFFYPWLKGATRYTLRFGLEHPVQTVALMLAAEHAYTYQKQTMGDVPFYEGFDVPVATKAIGLQLGIPGIYDGKQMGDLSKVFGDYSWVQGKYPMVIDTRQFLTFSTPVDIYRAAHGLVTGQANSPKFFDNLTPFLTNTITTLQGYDSFNHKEVPVSLKTFLDQSYKSLPQYREWQQLAPASWGGMDAKKRREVQQNAINPRTSEEDWWRLFGSGLAPAPFSTEVAAKRTLLNASTKIRHKTELEMDAKKYNLGEVTDTITRQLGEYDDMNHEIKQGMTPSESLDVIAKFYKRHPELPHSTELDSFIDNYATTDARVTHLSDYLRHNLEFHAWADYWKMRHHIDRAKAHAAHASLTNG